MAFTTLTFLLFVTAVVLIYYCVPKKVRWIILLAGSIYYYIATCGNMLVWVLLSCAIIYVFALLIEHRNQEYAEKIKSAENSETRTALKHAAKRVKRCLLSIALVISFGILAVFKYGEIVQAIVTPVSRLFTAQPPRLSDLAMPLGISFYTFQATGYLIDVFRGKQKAERNPLKLLLFVLYFPQIVQGPISRFGELSSQLYAGNSLAFDNLKNGIIRIGYGFMKKLILADRLSVIVTACFKHYTQYHGAVMFLASVAYGLQVYADFSGGIDIALGVSRMFGIRVTENFRQPYFATSISDFWRRWHITLGGWMRDYLFYPLSLSKPFARLGKWARQKLGNRWSRILVQGLVSFIVFTVVGIWHGSELKYTIYGFYNGGLIMLAVLCEPLFEQMFAKTHIDPDGKCWHIVRIVRTFVLASLGRCIGSSVNVAAAFHAFGQMLTHPDFAQVTVLGDMGLGTYDFIWMALMLVIVFIHDLSAEHKGDPLVTIQQKPIVVRWLIYLGIVFALLLLTPQDGGGGFLYAKF